MLYSESIDFGYLIETRKLQVRVLSSLLGLAYGKYTIPKSPYIRLYNT